MIALLLIKARIEADNAFYVCMMAGPPKRSKIQRERDLITIAELYLKGWSQAKIGEYLELNQSQISRELSKIKAAWKAEAVRDYDLHVDEQLRRLAMVESEYWEGWQRSQTAKEQSLQEKLTEAATSGDSRAKIQRRTESRIGDPRFLEGLLKCNQERSKLLDLYPTSSASDQPAAEQNLKMYLTNLEANSNGNQHQPVR